MTQAVKRACDACHRRKVKCDGINPCRNCSSAQLSCTYNAIPQKKGPKGSRAKVISELRETQRQTSLTAKVHNRMNNLPTPPEPAGGLPTPGLLSPELAKECVDFYFANMYDTAPILDRRQVEQQLPLLEQNREVYCLLTSLCGFIMLQPGMSLPPGDAYNLDMMPGAPIVASQLLLEECLRVRRGYEYLDTPSLTTLATSFFLYGCYHGIELNDKAWFYLREATTMMLMHGMNKEETYAQWDTVESSRRRRLYWLFYVFERAHAIRYQRPLTLQATIKPPSSQDDSTDPQAHQLNNFVMLVKLYHSFDDVLTGVWAKTRCTIPSQRTTGLQKQLDEMLSSFLCRDSQFAELHVNQQWLKTTHWQLTNSRINSHNGDGIDWQMPADLSRDLLNKLAAHFSGQNVEPVLIEKLLDIACNVTDYLSTQPASRDPFTAGPREYLSQVLQVLGALRHGMYQFMPLLFSKINDFLPRLTNPMLQNAPENCAMANIDIFDGFGNAGMAQPPSQMHMQLDTDYDRKFTMADYEKFSEMTNGAADTTGSAVNTNTSTMPTSTGSDINSPFGSSPSVMSPGMDFQRHDLNNFCTPIQEVVMSPLGASGQQQQHQSHHMLQGQYMSPQQVSTTMSQHHNLGGMQQTQNLNGFSSPSVTNQQSMNTTSMSAQHLMAQGMANGGANMMNQMGRQGTQRTNSYGLHGGQVPRTVGDFHALQRSNGEMGSIPSMGGEMDFGGMR